MELGRFPRLIFGDKCRGCGDWRSAKSTADANGSPVATAANSGADGSVSGGTMQLLARHGLFPIAMQLTDILPSPEWSRKSRRHRRVHAGIDLTTLGCSRRDYTVCLDHVTKKSSVDNFSVDDVPLDLCSSRSVITVLLDLLFRKQ